MVDLLLAEELFLLTHDDESGRAHGAPPGLAAGLAGALLLDLTAQELLALDGKELRAQPGSPDHPLLSAALTTIVKSDHPRSAAHWVRQLPRAIKPLGQQIGQSLVDRGVLSEQHRKVLGLFPSTSWPEVDPAPERELRARLNAILVNNAEPDLRSALLIALLLPLGLVRGVVDKPNRKAALQRAKTIKQTLPVGDGVATAVTRSVQATQNAIMAAAIIPLITAGAGS